MRARAINLEARRGLPKLWLVAHLDTKGQTIPMLVRIAGSVAQGAVAVLALVMLLLALTGVAISIRAWQSLQFAALAAAVPTLVCWVRNNSNGALDNATGVVAVLLAAQSLGDVANVGVLLTSGEELGLAGARDWAGKSSREIIVVNSDTFDDIGAWRCMHTGKSPKKLSAAVETSVSSLGFKVARGRMIPGILADSIAFSDLGIEAVTLSRATLSTLARIHTRRDNSVSLTGEGAADASRLLSDLARQLA